MTADRQREMSTAGPREVRWSDVSALATLDAEAFAADAWSEPTWWAELAARPRRGYAAYLDGEGIVAYGGIDHGGEVADLMTLVVAPRARGTGLGRALLAELERVAAQRGARLMMLEVRADNPGARRLYEDTGYQLLRTRPRYYQPGDVDALVLRKVLTSEPAEPAGCGPGNGRVHG